jgi:hypothetical protein
MPIAKAIGFARRARASNYVRATIEARSALLLSPYVSGAGLLQPAHQLRVAHVEDVGVVHAHRAVTASISKFAPTDASPESRTLQTAEVPGQAPVQPMKRAPVVGAATSVTEVPAV